MDYPEDLKYSSEHEWVAVDGNRARVGITDYADPYGSGWIFVVEMSDPGELDALLDAAGYRALVEG